MSNEDLKANSREDSFLETRGFERPRALLHMIPEDLATLLTLANHHILSARQFSRDHILQLVRLAARYETLPQMINRPLTGKILISAFYEPSTRTRLSFESAWHRLGGDVMSITDPASTGIAKGESLTDIGEMLNHYGDMAVLRDSHAHAVYEMSEPMRIPLINGGNGTDEHPTQALADIYALLKWRPELTDQNLVSASRIKIGIVGVPSEMRTVRSLLILLCLFSGGIDEIVIISESESPFSPGQREELEKAGLSIRVNANLDEELPKLDVVYINTIAWTGETFETMGLQYRLSADSALKPDSIVMHPLARGSELDPSLDNTRHNWYFAQSRGAVFVRMALFSVLLKVLF